MNTKILRSRARVIESGDFTGKITQRNGGRMDTRKKQLINLPDDQKAWIMRVVELAVQRGQDCNQTVVMRAIVGNAMKEDPEEFVARLEKITLAARLAEIERRSAALEAEKARLTEALSRDGNQLAQM